VADASGRTLCTSTGTNNAGINRVQWNLGTPLVPAPGGGGGGGGGGRGGAPPDPSCSGPAAGAAGGGGGGGGRGGAGAAAGTYTVKLTVNGKDFTKTVQVLEDRWIDER
jgi:hypothetical protein